MSDESPLLHLKSKYEHAVERHARGEMTDKSFGETRSKLRAEAKKAGIDPELVAPKVTGPARAVTATLATVRSIPLDVVADDPAIQQRAAHIDPELVEEYAEALASGVVFPPIIGFATEDPPSKVWVADGFHRVAAARRADKVEVQVDLRTGDARAALLFACGVNAEHGMRRTVFDRRRAVGTLLRDPEWGQRSDRWVADTAKVSPTFVGRIRAELTPEPAKVTVHVDSQIDEPRTVEVRREPATVRAGRDGRTTNTSGIGKKPRPVEAEVRRANREARETLSAAQAQNVAHRFGAAVSDLKRVIDKLDPGDVHRLAHLAAGVLGDLLERMEGADAQEVVDALQETVEAVWKDDSDA